MKNFKYLILLIVFASFLHATTNNYVGNYVYNHDNRYEKTVTLKSDGTGSWTYHNYKSDMYDYDEKIAWKYHEAENTIEIKLLTKKGYAIQYENAQGFILEILKDNQLFVKGSGDLIFTKE